MNSRCARLVLCLLFALPALSLSIHHAAGQDWIRYPAISPDGHSIAFSYGGDIWVADGARGEDGRAWITKRNDEWVVLGADGPARMLTSHDGYERSPVWSPDGKWIAFAGFWHGNADVFLVSRDGGSAKRLTFHSADDVPTAFTPDGKHVLFTSRRQDAPQAAIGSAAMGELYSVSVEGGRPSQVLTTTAE